MNTLFCLRETFSTMQQLLFAAVRNDCATCAIFDSHYIRAKGELQHGVVQVDQGTDLNKELQRFAAPTTHSSVCVVCIQSQVSQNT